MPGETKADRQKENDLDLLDQHVERVGEQPLESDPAFPDGKHDAAETSLGQNHAGRGFRDVGCRGNGDPNLRLSQSRRIVHPVAAHADDMIAMLQSLYQLVLLLGNDAREHAIFIDALIFGNFLGRA